MVKIKRPRILIMEHLSPFAHVPISTKVLPGDNHPEGLMIDLAWL
jgi:hypothetical protein